MKRIAIVGAGISGLTCAHFLKEQSNVVVFEKESTPGGLIRCHRVNGNLFHLCGGHVFNSKRKDVLNWFWSHFDADSEFVKTERKSAICLKNNSIIPYPIENHIYMLDKNTQDNCIRDILSMASDHNDNPTEFESFLRGKFGETLFNEYFRPYNEKIWGRDLKQVPLDWLEGKLPMPTLQEILFNNMNHIEEKQFVHSSFWYEKEGGSQFLADRLAEGLNIRYDTPIMSIRKEGDEWKVNEEAFDMVVFCGNIKDIPFLLSGVDIDSFITPIENLEYHGTTSVLCEIDNNPYSWIYLPDPSYDSHRIICTGNFSASNNSGEKLTATIEFTDYFDENSIKDNLLKMPWHPKYLAHNYSKYSYPIQNHNTREMIQSLKSTLEEKCFYMSGRFADWEYYNMDVAIGAAMDLCNRM